MAYESWKNLKGNDIPSTPRFSEKLLEYLYPNSIVLDLGCGYGRLSGFLASKGCNVYGIDINSNAIEEAKKNPHLSKVEFSVIFLNHYKYLSRSIIYCFYNLLCCFFYSFF